jgi:general secretion pathway protein H
MVVLSMGVVGSDREIEREALRLRGLLDLLREEALMQTRDYGVLFTANGYRFYIYDYQQLLWVDPPNDELLRQHQIAESLNLSLLVEDRELVLAPGFEALDDDEAEPQIMILSSGELTPFTAEVSRDLTPGRFTLSASFDGKIEITEDGFDAR